MKGIAKMKNKTLENIRLCCYLALFFCLVWAFTMVRYIIADVIGLDSWARPIDWSESTALKIIMLSFYVLGTVAMIAMCVKVVFNTLKGLRENTVFPQSNVKLMFWIALADFVYQLGFNNLSVLWNEILFQLPHTVFVTPFFLLFFAFMYKVAADAVEENSLTV